MNSRMWIISLAILMIASTHSTLNAGVVGVGSGLQVAPSNPSGVHTTSANSQPVNILNQARRLVAEQQKLTPALMLLTENFPATQLHVEYATSILETVSGIIEAAKVKEEVELANDAIKYARSVIDQSIQNDQLAGHGKVEMAYPFMQSISRVAHATIKIDDKVAAAMLVQVGQIARNLQVNPTFPSPALRGIAANIVAEAKGYALHGDLEKATESLRLAYQWGFVDFHIALNDEVLCSIDTSGNLERMTLEARKRYKTTVRGQVQNALANFARHSLEFQLQGLESGKTISSADYRGKLLVLDMGATWCAPCVKSIPHLQQLQKEFGEKGVSILNASFENGATQKENLDLLKKFVAQHEIEYDVALGTDALKASIPAFQTFPGLVFVDEQGFVRYVANGYHDYTQIATIVEVILESSPSNQPF